MRAVHWLVAVGATSVVLTACPDRRQPQPPQEQGSQLLLVAGEGEGAADADNTERNVRDRDGRTLTPIDQSNAERDLELTRRIREAITSDDSFSTLARNVKIITRDGQVTLRGPVEDEQEKAAIETIAQRTAGAGRVESQLETTREAEKAEE
jgi:osmotically-inducible protein OsmY